jgi:hypothetical protein
MTAPFKAPPGFHWIWIKQFRHWRSGKIVRAEDHGKKAFCLLVRG